jgi:multidrug efflux system membrane fusion protein
MKRTVLVLSIAVCCASLVIAGAACSKSSASPSGGGAAGAKGKRGSGLAFPVEVAPIVLRQLDYVVSAPGVIQAFEQVQVTARVAGAVDRVSFAEGQTVKKGQALASIEIARYQVAVDLAKAGVDKAAATQAQAEAELARRQAATASNPGLITGEEIGTYQTAVATAKADVASAKEGVRVAQLNLADSYVKAPIDGVIQTRTVETGQYLQPGVVLATLLQRDPLLLKFAVSEEDAPRLTVGMTANISLRESARTYAAKITLVSGAADPASHLVAITGEVDDKEHKYWLRPGAFCDVAVPIGAPRPAVIVPELAVRASEKGFLAYTITGTTAHEKIVTLGMHTPGGQVEVTQGLAAGDLLVVRGGEALSDGATVVISDRTTLETYDAGTPAPTATSAPMPTWSAQSATPATAPAPSIRTASGHR